MNLHADGLAVPHSEPAFIGAQSQISENATPLFGLIRDEPLVEQGWAPPLALPSPTTYPDALQRFLDVTIALAALLVLWPVLLITALLVRLSGPGPIIYHHMRLGRNGETFGCLKFRTMRPDADRMLQTLLDSSPQLRTEWLQERKLRNDPRITAIGGFLRQYSVDELPQIFNVLRGEMSIVGPRPLATDEAHYYAESFAVYCSLRPGITGLWQVSGRNEVCYEYRVQLDCEYARVRSLRSDIWIILRTVPVVFRGTGI
jgi:exopolysaccharide production protein ExoY